MPFPRIFEMDLTLPCVSEPIGRDGQEKEKGEVHAGCSSSMHVRRRKCNDDDACPPSPFRQAMGTILSRVSSIKSKVNLSSSLRYFNDEPDF